MKNNVSFRFSFFYLLFAGVMCAMLFSRCTGKGGITTQDLLGDWKCIDGKLNGNPYDAVKGFYFKFTEKAVTSNIFAELSLPETIENYEFKDGKLLAPARTEPVFTVAEFKEGVLSVNLAVQDMQFLLNLKK